MSKQAEKANCYVRRTKIINKLSCVNISSKDPKVLAEFYRTIGVPVYVNNNCYDGWNLGNPNDSGTACVWDENNCGKVNGVLSHWFLMLAIYRKLMKILKAKASKLSHQEQPFGTETARSSSQNNDNVLETAWNVCRIPIVKCILCWATDYGFTVLVRWIPITDLRVHNQAPPIIIPNVTRLITLVSIP